MVSINRKYLICTELIKETDKYLYLTKQTNKQNNLKPQRVHFQFEFVQHKIVENKVGSHTCPRYKWINSVWGYLPEVFFFKQKTEYNFQGMIYLTCQVQKGDANQDVLPSSAVPFLSESFTGESWGPVKWKPRHPELPFLKLRMPSSATGP